jgi:DNA polymerase-3 subunit delta
MRIQSDAIERALGRGLPRACLVAGDEMLLTGEAADAVRARARADGFSGRELFVADRGFDWPALRAASRTLSLFAEKRILELRMPTPRPGKEGGAVLAELAADPGADNLLLVVTARPERETWSSAWFKAFDRHGLFVETRSVEIARLPQWIAARASRRGLTIDAEGAALLAERVEGNLLAAHQEIEMLALLHAGERIGVDEVVDSVGNSARYDVFQLGEAALVGDAARALRILDGLRAEGVEPPLVLWAVCREIRALADARSGAAKQAYGVQAERRAALVERAARRMAGQPLEPLFRAAARVDRLAKGQAPGDPWLSLVGLVAALAGAGTPAATAA